MKFSKNQIINLGLHFTKILRLQFILTFIHYTLISAIIGDFLGAIVNL